MRILFVDLFVEWVAHFELIKFLTESIQNTKPVRLKAMFSLDNSASTDKLPAISDVREKF